MSAGQESKAVDYSIGSSPPRVEDERLIRGRGRFTDDIRAANEAALVMVRSPHAFARIAGIDLEAARAAAGVIAVATVEDLKRDGVGPLPCAIKYPGPDGKPMFVPPRPALAQEFVRFVGDPVVAVLAETQAQARDAADLCVVEYEAQDAVTDAGMAFAEGAPQLWDRAPRNTGFTSSAATGPRSMLPSLRPTGSLPPNCAYRG